MSSRPSPTTGADWSTPNLTTREQRGKWAYYRLVDGTLDAMAGALAPAAAS